MNSVAVTPNPQMLLFFRFSSAFQQFVPQRSFFFIMAFIHVSYPFSPSKLQQDPRPSVPSLVRLQVSRCDTSSVPLFCLPPHFCGILFLNYRYATNAVSINNMSVAMIMNFNASS